ncbi:MAG: hypothetical protein FDZ70_01350, partial [Actinobacteria bacterium]
MRGKGIIAAAAAALGSTALALLQPGLTGGVAPAWVGVAGAVGAVVATAAVFRLPAAREWSSLGTAAIARQVAGGAAGLAAAPLLVMANRYTDAPSASEALFLTTAGWAFVAAAGGALLERRAGRPVSLMAAVSALVGCAALVASWEFPSSFSPFVRFPREEAAFLVAGACWALYSVLMAREPAAAKRPAAWVAALTGLVVSVAALAFSGELARSEVPRLAAYAAASAVFVAGWLVLLRDVGLMRSAAALFAPPVLVTALSWAAAGTIAGGQPMLLGRTAAAAALAAVSAGVLAWPGPAAEVVQPVRRAVALGAAVLAGALAVAGLAADAVGASVSVPYAHLAPPTAEDGEFPGAGWTCKIVG